MQDLTKLVELLRTLREHGVTKYSTPELTLELGSATFAPVAAPEQPTEFSLDDVERELSRTRALDSLPAQYRDLLKAGR